MPQGGWVELDRVCECIRGRIELIEREQRSSEHVPGTSILRGETDNRPVDVGSGLVILALVSLVGVDVQISGFVSGDYILGG